jgi:hypothetical protein
MPLLPPYQNLAENPNSIFNASRRVAEMSLKNIRSPTGEDETYLSAVKSQQDLTADFLQFKNLMADTLSQYEILFHYPPPTNNAEAYGALSVLKFLNNSIKKTTLYLTNNIKPRISGLNGKQYSEFEKLYNLIYYEYRPKLGAIYTHFKAMNYADESFDFLEENTEDLLEQMGISINSYQQNEPGEYSMSGAGRNFYGKQVSNSKDIPTIWNKFAKNCPTKYLL